MPASVILSYRDTKSSSLLCLENAHRWFVLPPVIQELYVIMMKAKHLEIQLKMKIECHDPMSTLAYCILKFKNAFPWKYRYMYIRSIDFASVSVIFLLVFVTVLTLWNFVFLFLLYKSDVLPF